MLNVDEKAGEETAHILHDAATTVSDANTVFTTMADAYQQSQNIVQVNSADLESVLSASQGPSSPFRGLLTDRAIIKKNLYLSYSV